MRQPAVINARVLGFVDAYDLMPQGVVSFPDLVRGIAEKYSFQKYPKTIEEHDISKGVVFLEGKDEDRPIIKFAIWDSTLVLETRVNTDESKELLDSILAWGAAAYSLNYQKGTIKRFAYISDVSFYSDAPLLALNPAVVNLAAKCSELLSDIWQEPVEYQPLSLRVGHDPVKRKSGIAPFSIERRGNARFSENKYFSEAPLPTHVHFDLLRQFEQEIG